MEINKNANYVIGIDLGGTNVRASVIDKSGKIIGEDRTDSKAMDGLMLTVGQIVHAARGAIAASGVSRDDIAGIGMGVPGTVIDQTGMVMWSPNFKDWNGVQLREPIEELMGMPVSMGNDANVAALGEYVFGAGKGSKIMVMFTLGTGIGSGLIINGEIYIGVSGTAPEIGHHIIIADGPQCSCGRRGCVEAIARRDAIIERAARKIYKGRKTMLVEMSGPDLIDLTPAVISKAASKGDAVAIETLEETGYYIGIAVANAVNILNPDKVVIGGGIAQAGDLLFDPIRRTAAVNGLPNPMKVVEIIPASLGDDAGPLGGAAMVLHKMG